MLRAAWFMCGLALAGVLAACGGARHAPEARRSEPDAGVARTHGDELASGPLAVFDKVVTLEVLFPDPAVRSRYEALPTEQHGAERSYSFGLKLEPGMEKSRHFHFITVTVAPKSDHPPRQLGGVGGPNGGFVDRPFETPDGRFEGRISEGMLLPNTVSVPKFDLARTAEALSTRYELQRTK